MRISDWSSDVCSSDLASEINPADYQASLFLAQAHASMGRKQDEMRVRLGMLGTLEHRFALNPQTTPRCTIGRQNSCMSGGRKNSPSWAETRLGQGREEPWAS